MLKLLQKLNKIPKVTWQDLANWLELNNAYLSQILNERVPLSNKVIKRLKNFNTTEQHILEEDWQTFAVTFTIENITNK